MTESGKIPAIAPSPSEAMAAPAGAMRRDAATLAASSQRTDRVATAIMFGYAETRIHAGADAGDGAVDLPVQREAHTYWPVVNSSGVKGALREVAEATVAGGRASDKSAGCFQDQDQIDAVFGPEGTKQLYEGALGLGDLQLLLLPVRSLNSRFKWVTCCEVLERYLDHRTRLGLPAPGDPALQLQIPSEPNSAQHQAWTVSTTETLFLEERMVLGSPCKLLEAWVTHFAEVASRASPDITALNRLKARIGSNLVVVDADCFRWLCEHATSLDPRVKLTSNKTVDGGAFWIEETLLPDTLLYVPLQAAAARPVAKQQMDATAVLAKIASLFDIHRGSPYLRVGGNETLGQGWMRVRLETGPSVTQSNPDGRTHDGGQK